MKSKSTEHERLILIEKIAALRKKKPLPKQKLKKLLWRIAQIDYVPESKAHCDSITHEHFIHNKHSEQINCGFTVGSDLVPIQLPPTPEDHDANLGWHETDPKPANTFKQPSDTLAAIVQWLSSENDKDTTIDNIGLKAIALIQSLRPELLTDKGTAAEVGRRFGVTRQAIVRLQKQIKQLTDGRFHHRGNHMSGQQRRKEIAIEQHKKAGHNLHIIK